MAGSGIETPGDILLCQLSKTALSSMASLLDFNTVMKLSKFMGCSESEPIQIGD